MPGSSHGDGGVLFVRDSGLCLAVAAFGLSMVRFRGRSSLDQVVLIRRSSTGLSLSGCLASVTYLLVEGYSLKAATWLYCFSCCLAYLDDVEGSLLTNLSSELCLACLI
jgi:hypothetical protein